ncbi:Protein Y9C2UA.1 c [Aphelenchoides avenae]|nr:Protein Y9C2UA.1 c [Aphelenchus avenae]
MTTKLYNTTAASQSISRNSSDEWLVLTTSTAMAAQATSARTTTAEYDYENVADSASSGGSSDYHYYNYYDHTMSPEVLSTQIQNGSVLVASSVCILIQFYISVFGRRMRLDPLRWHTLNVSVWNMFQLFLFTDQSSNSPWRGFLRNTVLVNNKVEMEMMTLTIFPTTMIFVLPAMLIAHFKPSVTRGATYKWSVWVPIIVFVNILTIVAYFSYEWWSVDKHGNLRTWAVPVEAFQVAVMLLFLVTLLYFTMGTLVALLYFLCVSATGRAGKTHANLGSRTVDLFLLWLYASVIGWMHVPANAQNMAPFIMQKIVPLLRNHDGGFDIGGGGVSIPDLTPLIIFLGLKEPSELLIPLTECLLTGLCIRMYREQVKPP